MARADDGTSGTSDVLVKDTMESRTEKQPPDEADGKKEAEEETVDVITTRSDMKKKDRRFVRDSVAIIYQKVRRDPSIPPVKKMYKFVTMLKNLLDRRFRPRWNVLCGQNVGYSAKFRKGTLGIYKMDKTYSVVVYKSPATEIVDAQAPLWEIPTAVPKRQVEFLHYPQEGAISYTLDTSKIKEFLQRTCVHFGKDDDPLDLSAKVRNLLTREFGQIWHVYVGSDFIAECANNRRNDFLISVGKTKLLCFQHEQHDPPRVDWLKLLNALPYAMFMVFILLFLAFSAMCGENPKFNIHEKLSPELAQPVHHGLCVWGPEHGLLYLGSLVFGSVALKTVMNRL